MKRTYVATTKKDRLLIIIMTVIVILFVVLAFLFKDRKGLGLSKTELAEAYNNDMTKLVISEVMTSNGGVWVNGQNEKSDYLELYNGTDKAINLKGYGLSDDATTVKWRFPDYELASHSYLVVSLNGISNGTMTANFKLTSAGGETIILTSDTGHILDAVDTVSMETNQVMMRQQDGSWAVCDSGTPGYENSQAGLQAYIASLTGDNDGLVINEFLTRNKGDFTLSDGSQPGFIEIKNTSSHNISLAEYRLSDSTAVPFKYALPAVILAPGQIYVVYTGSNDSGSSAPYTGFNLNSTLGAVVLSHNGVITQTVSYENLTNGYAQYRTDSGLYQNSATVSAGYENNSGGIDAFQQEYQPTPAALIISEVMSNNTKYLAQNGANYYDWIELYNNSGADINLADYYLTNDAAALGMYKLPEVTLKPGEYYVVMCSGNVLLTNNSYYHASFKISDHESLYLTDGTSIKDSIFAADIPLNYSYCRQSDYGWTYSSAPTPKAANSAGLRTVANEVVFSQSGGVYNDVQNVTITLQGSGTIYYTTDGSKPTSKSRVYTGPLVLSKTTVIKTVQMITGQVTSAVTVNSYIINENHTMPVVSLSADPSDLSYVNSHPSSRGLERQGYVELYEEDGSFSLPCSIALFGGNARYLTKKSYGLRFDSQWGASELDYQVFDNRDCSVYDALVLRSGSTDYYDAFIRDILGTSLVSDSTNVDTQAYKTVIVYINGSYWGIYNLREKINAHFVMDHYNVSKDSITLCRIDGKAQAGSYKSYSNLRAYARSHDMSVAANYQYMETQINMSDLCDYWIAEVYVTNNDMLNCRFFKSSEFDDNRWHYIFYDLDYAWLNEDVNYYTKYLTSSRGLGLPGTYVYENDIIKALFSSSVFRSLFVERLTYNMQNTWKLENVLARIDQLQASFEPEMARNQQRWGLSYSHWVSEVDELRQYAKDRDRYLRSQTKSFFGLTDAQIKAIFDGEG